MWSTQKKKRNWKERDWAVSRYCPWNGAMKLVRVRVTVGWIIIVWKLFFFMFISSFVFSAELDKPIESETKSDAKIKVYLSQWEGPGHLLWFVVSSFLEKSVNSRLLWVTICLIYRVNINLLKNEYFIFEISHQATYTSVLIGRKSIVYSTCILAAIYFWRSRVV